MDLLLFNSNPVLIPCYHGPFVRSGTVLTGNQHSLRRFYLTKFLGALPNKNIPPALGRAHNFQKCTFAFFQMSDQHPLTAATLFKGHHGGKGLASMQTKMSITKKSRTKSKHSQGSASTKSRKKRSPRSSATGDASTSLATSQNTSPDVLLTPPSDWVQGHGGNKKDPAKQTVQAYVGLHLFRELKFITHAPSQLVYNTHDARTACFNVLNGCKCAIANIDREKWWNTKGSVWVYDAITNLRNSKVEALKNAFWSKFLYLLCVFCNDCF